MKNIILTIFMFASFFTLHAQSINQSFSVTINTDIPVAGRPWTLTFIIDYPEPDSVSITMPSLQQTGAKDGEITLDRIFKQTRQDNENTQTVVQYRFNVLKSGSINIDKFIIECPYGIVETNPLLLEIQEAPEVPVRVTQTPLVLRLVWEINPPLSGTVWQMEKGQRAVLSLRHSSQNRSVINPPPGIFLPEVPPGVIISLSEPSTSDQIAANMIFIPAETGVFSLAARTVSYENTQYQIPALRINILESSREFTAADKQEINFQEEQTSFLDTQENIDKLNAHKYFPRTLIFIFSVSGFFIVIISLIIIYIFLRKGTK